MKSKLMVYLVPVIFFVFLLYGYGVNENVTQGSKNECCIDGYAYYAGAPSPASGCDVYIKDPSNNIITRCTTDSNGYFRCCLDLKSEIPLKVHVVCPNDCEGWKFNVLCPSTTSPIPVNCF